MNQRQYALHRRTLAGDIEAFRAWVYPALAPQLARLDGHWKQAASYHPAMLVFHRSDGLAAILSGSVEGDGQRWLHLSLSRARKLPEYTDLARAKAAFFGPDALAIQVFAPVSEHVNDHPYCLHLWACLDGAPLPDFRRAEPLTGRLTI